MERRDSFQECLEIENQKRGWVRPTSLVSPLNGMRYILLQQLLAVSASFFTKQLKGLFVLNKGFINCFFDIFFFFFSNRFAECFQDFFVTNDIVSANAFSL